MFAARLVGAFSSAFRPVMSAVRPMAPPSFLSPWNQMVTRGMANHRHKKMIKLAKGYRGRANRCFTVALQRVYKARQYAYRDRKVRKRDYRRLWIQRINAGSRMYGMPYSTLINRMKLANVGLNRKVLADMAVTEPLSFRSVIEVAKVASKK